MSIANDLERQMLDLINDERSALGLDPLTLELRLNNSSEDHSTWMLNTDTFSHTGIGGSNPGERMQDADFAFSGNWTWGENIAWQSERGPVGLDDDVIDLHDALMNSPGHRANILNPNFEVIGIGIELGEFEGWEAVMVTQNFASTDATVLLDEPGAPELPADIVNSAPELAVNDITVSKLKGERSTKLKKHVDLTDADGDSPVWFELLDTEGRNNFKFKGGDRIDASTPYRVDAEDFGQIRVTNNKKIGTTTLQIRAFDGEDVGEWEEFNLTTLSADDWLLMA